MAALAPRATPVSVDDLARLRVLEACLEALTAENEILKHRLEGVRPSGGAARREPTDLVGRIRCICRPVGLRQIYSSANHLRPRRD